MPPTLPLFFGPFEIDPASQTLCRGEEPVALRAATSLAALWQKQGRTNEARELLAPCVAELSEGLELPDVAAAKTLLDEMG